ncbi:hypothetical protein K469DRAFT_682407 [Zopfia rhizophila CBS 207.26]|uniref:Uncharacterized protein n=1 Tax=Zopfia rhizophila CBS 207.26 TaxID=1314779 RepID=A0A6A6EEX8_9PEZI|nr:hypothetical protein K469DRAFT_682407 [Zopfia rhizophila CBS 207.26]
MRRHFHLFRHQHPHPQIVHVPDRPSEAVAIAQPQTLEFESSPASGAIQPCCHSDHDGESSKCDGQYFLDERRNVNQPSAQDQEEDSTIRQTESTELHGNPPAATELTSAIPEQSTITVMRKTPIEPKTAVMSFTLRRYQTYVQLNLTVSVLLGSYDNSQIWTPQPWTRNVMRNRRKDHRRNARRWGQGLRSVVPRCEAASQQPFP